jgi:NAD(P)-dependent dehydrogenase (short-subunit alcohol dehydrogenase family)
VPDLSLVGKVAVVTGGGTGIGRGIATLFAEAGADVVVGSRNLANLERAAAEIRDLGRRSLAVRTDTSQKADVDNLIQTTVREFGTIDILVNNSAIVTTGELLNMPEDAWDQVIDVNLKGYTICSQAAGRIMVEHNRGNIINISSVEGMKVGPARNSAYGITKAGILMLTKVLAKELGPHNIRVNSVAPGLIKVERNEFLWGVEEKRKLFEEEIVLGRIGEPIDVAYAALFLASDAARHITGQSIVVDGGTSI